MPNGLTRIVAPLSGFPPFHERPVDFTEAHHFGICNGPYHSHYFLPSPGYFHPYQRRSDQGQIGHHEHNGHLGPSGENRFCLLTEYFLIPRYHKLVVSPVWAKQLVYRQGRDNAIWQNRQNVRSADSLRSTEEVDHFLDIIVVKHRWAVYLSPCALGSGKNHP